VRTSIGAGFPVVASVNIMKNTIVIGIFGIRVKTISQEQFESRVFTLTPNILREMHRLSQDLWPIFPG